MKEKTQDSAPLPGSLLAGQMLRREAEKCVLEEAPLEKIDTMSKAEIKQLFHELRVHQIELEMQNEELRIAQQALDVSNARYLDLYDFAPIGYITLNEQGIILEANLSAATLLGKARSELLMRSLSGFILKEDQDIYYLHRKLLFESGEPQECELRMVNKAGQFFWAHLTSIDAQYNGESVFRIVISNVTERKRSEAENKKLQAQLTQADKMESVGRLAGGVAHDFNNMLTVILGYTEAAMEEIDPSEPLYSNLQEIRNSAQHSADLTKQLLTFARKQIIEPKILDLNKITRRMLIMLQRLIGEDIEIVWKSSENLWPIEIDPSQIDQILANLCVNARDAISNVGKIIIETDMKTFAPAYCAEHKDVIPGDFVLLMVSDNGCGMDRETLNNLFEPFFTTKEMGKGTGLGLATIYGIVKENKGFINVYSEPGQGTTFKIYLPRCMSAEETSENNLLREPVPGGDETILLVEDEPAILKLTQMILEGLGYSVIIATLPGGSHPARP
ncbi:PAS domain S-box protein [Desulforhopalus vacuolatus]|uniref:ATP-binding response regulator n=1 Tax=Desulforhopalus vacuolatus TaxID=40414 RepID=UPI0019666071|nr:PAS domain-containing sensor histidine kinase [Desulforhopalus vacuolatus]MBM9518458.1 PAS domain S-box protein [Desulforhopalus vacuolatus]